MRWALRALHLRRWQQNRVAVHAFSMKDQQLLRRGATHTLLPVCSLTALPLVRCWQRVEGPGGIDVGGGGVHGGMAEGGPGGEQPSRLPLLQLQGGEGGRVHGGMA